MVSIMLCFAATTAIVIDSFPNLREIIPGSGFSVSIASKIARKIFDVLFFNMSSRGDNMIAWMTIINLFLALLYLAIVLFILFGVIQALYEYGGKRISHKKETYMTFIFVLLALLSICGLIWASHFRILLGISAGLLILSFGRYFTEFDFSFPWNAYYGHPDIAEYMLFCIGLLSLTGLIGNLLGSTTRLSFLRSGLWYLPLSIVLSIVGIIYEVIILKRKRRYKAIEDEFSSLMELSKHEEALKVCTDAIRNYPFYRYYIVDHYGRRPCPRKPWPHQEAIRRAWEAKYAVLLGRSQYEAAVKFLTQAIADCPKSIDFWGNKARALAILGRGDKPEHYEDLLEFCSRAIQEFPDRVDFWDYKAEALTKLARHREVVEFCSRAIQEFPDRVGFWQKKGEVLMLLGRYEEAVEFYSRAIQEFPKRVDFWQKKGEVLMLLGKYEEAMEFCSQALRTYPEISFDFQRRRRKASPVRDEVLASQLEVLNEKGKKLRREVKLDEAIACYEEALRLDVTYGKAWINKGNALSQLGRHEEAMLCFDIGINLEPKDPNGWDGKSMAYFNLGRYDESLMYCDESIRLNPELEHSWANKGRVLVTLKRYEEALVCADRGIQLAPNDDRAWCRRAELLVMMQHYQDALECVEKAIQIAPDSEDVWGNFSYIVIDLLVSQGKGNEAIRLVDKVIHSSNNSPHAWRLKSNVLYYLDREEEALRCIDEAIQLDPSSPREWMEKVWLLYNFGRYQETLSLCDKVIQLDPNSSKAFEHKGSALFKLERRREALECLDQAIQLDPNDAEAWKMKSFTLRELGSYDDSLVCANRSIELDPDIADAWLAKGVALLSLKRYNESLECAKNVLALAESENDRLNAQSLIDAAKAPGSIQMQPNSVRIQKEFGSLGHTVSKTQQDYPRRLTKEEQEKVAEREAARMEIRLNANPITHKILFPDE